jgi:uncharacterized protein (TIGR02271 family)
MSAFDPEQLTDVPVVDRDGQKFGTIADVYVDQLTGQPEWVLVQSGLFGKKETFVPLNRAITQKDAIQVPYSKDQVKDAPKVDPDGELSLEEEDRLYEHYELAVSAEPTEAGADEASPDESHAGPAAIGGDDAMTRSEEELRLGTVRRPSELVRLKKYVVTEPVTTTVPVEREVVRVEREPITDENVEQAMAGPDISAGEHEMVLSEDEVVVEKQAVPKERVRLDTEVVTEEQTVAENLRKERIEVEGDVRR